MAAETGHLVFVTLHTTDTTQSFSRMLEFFPASEQAFIRSTLANSLRAVMAQRLLPSSQPDVRVVPATEVLLNTPVVAQCIRESRDEDLTAAIADSKDEGMHTFNDSLVAPGRKQAGRSTRRRRIRSQSRTIAFARTWYSRQSGRPRLTRASKIGSDSLRASHGSVTTMPSLRPAIAR